MQKLIGKIIGYYRQNIMGILRKNAKVILPIEMLRWYVSGKNCQSQEKGPISCWTF